MCLYRSELLPFLEKKAEILIKDKPIEIAETFDTLRNYYSSTERPRVDLSGFLIVSAWENKSYMLAFRIERETERLTRKFLARQKILHITSQHYRGEIRFLYQFSGEVQIEGTQFPRNTSIRFRKLGLPFEPKIGMKVCFIIEFRPSQIRAIDLYPI